MPWTCNLYVYQWNVCNMGGGFIVKANIATTG